MENKDNPPIKKEAESLNLEPKPGYTKGGVKKLSFAPKAPIKKNKPVKQAIEVKQESSESKTFEKERGRAKGRGRGDGKGRDDGRGRGSTRGRGEVVMTASGPFAMGPTGLSSGFGNKKASSGVNTTSFGTSAVGFAISNEEEENKEIYEDAELLVHYEGEVKVEEEEIKSEEEIEGDLRKLNIKSENICNLSDTIDHLNPKKELLCFQLPSVLPKFKIDTGIQEVGKPDGDQYIDQLNKIDGKVGKLIFYKSGKVMMKYGDILFNVSKASKTSFHQEIVALDSNNKEAYSLAPIKEKFLVVPDLDSLLN
ncbi:hypothetical protein K502DRAFT_344683 [Neoconidiobolus thromboides FSU 785]|nr:hypothetical protein K502DRAFT_344683 [Neoconidiobolus thromboides FSU 785]